MRKQRAHSRDSVRKPNSSKLAHVGGSDRLLTRRTKTRVLVFVTDDHPETTPRTVPERLPFVDLVLHSTRGSERK